MTYIELFQCNINILSRMGKCVRAFRRQNFDRGIRLFQELLSQIQRQVQFLLSDDETLREAGIQADGQYLVELLSDLMQAQEQHDFILLPDLLELTIEPFTIEQQIRLQQYASEKSEENFKNIELWKQPYLYSRLYPNHLSRNLEVLQQVNPQLAKDIRAYIPEISIRGQEIAGEQGNTYFIEETQTGFLTLRVQDAKGMSYYLHSNKDVLAEADVFAQTYINREAMSCHILGAGLGYHWWAVGEESLFAKKVHVYETDKTILVLNLMYRDLTAPLQGWLVLHHDPELQELSKALGKEPLGFLIHYPSLRKLEQEKLRQSFEKFFITDNSFRNHENQLIINFQLNKQKLEEEKIAESGTFIDALHEKKVVIVAAGPSLDKNIHLLKEYAGEEGLFILATGTVWYKLSQMGIRPDAVMVTDSNERVIHQIRTNETESIPMLMLSTAFWGFAKRYQGQKYLLLQRDFEPAEKFAEKHGYHLYQTGGSVSTTALDFAIYAKAKEIIFIGLDLAFTDNLAHAAGTSNRLAAEAEELIPVKAYDGGTVLADQKFIIYREWMERRLQEQDAKSCSVINATEGGSYLAGAEHRKLSEVLKRQK